MADSPQVDDYYNAGIQKRCAFKAAMKVQLLNACSGTSKEVNIRIFITSSSGL